MQRNYDANDINIITNLQKQIRAKQARKQFSITHLPDAAASNEPAFLVGNDPKMAELKPYAGMPGKVALIGTSCLRSLSVVCKLSNKDQTPKLIIVDISKNVVKLWRMIRAIAEDNQVNTDAEFITLLEDKLAANKTLYRHIAADALNPSKNEFMNPGVKYLNQDPINFMKAMFRIYDFEHVKAIIKHTTVIQQSWADPELFVKLKNILVHNGVDKTVMYPSNIVSCVSPEDGEKLLQNIAILNPEVAIHTDCCVTHHIPERIVLSVDGDHDPQNLMFKLFAGAASGCGKTNTVKQKTSAERPEMSSKTLAALGRAMFGGGQ